jgi:hypothetical protein
MSEEGSSVHSLRLPDKLFKALEDDMNQRKVKSFSEELIQALEHFLKCHATEEANMMKLIILRYKANCLKCHRKIDAGEYAIYGRGVGAICLDCHVQRVGDKTAIAKYLRNRELDKVYHALKRECETLAERVEVFRTLDKFESIVEAQKSVNELIEKYLKSGLATPEEQNILLELKERKKSLEALEEEVRKFMERYLKDARWLKKKARPEEESQYA